MVFSTSEDVLLALVGTDQEADDAIRHIRSELGDQILRHLNRKAGWLSLQDKEDVIQDIYTTLWRKGRDQTLNIDVRLEALLMTMAYNAAVDMLRRRQTQTRHLDSNTYKVLCEEAIAGTTVSAKSRSKERVTRAAGVLSAFRDWIHSLPEKQLEVAYVMADCYGEMMAETKEFPARLGPTVIYDEMLHRGMKPSSKMAFKRAMQEIRDKFEGYLDADVELRTLRRT